MEIHEFDNEIHDLLNNAYNAALELNKGHYLPQELKMMLVATNLQSLIKTILIADAEPESHSLNLKQMALGLMGTVDFMMDDIENELPGSMV